MTVLNFVEDAHAVGVTSAVTLRSQRMLDWAKNAGVFKNADVDLNQFIPTVVERQLATAEQGVKIAAIVMLHTAYERCLWRLVRVG